MKTIIIYFFVLLGNVIPNDEATCLIHKYKGKWKGNDLILVVNDATYKNILSYKGTIKGYTKFKNNVCSFEGTFELNSKKAGHYNIWISESGQEKYCNASFSGEIICYTDGTATYKGIIAYETTTKVKEDYIELNSFD